MSARGPDQRAIADLVRGIFSSFAAHDVAGIEAALDDMCTIWDVFTPRLLRGRTEREAFHAADQRQAQARGPLSWTLHEPLIDVWDDTAVARYLLDFRYGPPRAVAGACPHHRRPAPVRGSLADRPPP